MRLLPSLCLMLLASTGLAAETRVKDEAAIRKSTEEFFAAWNANDIKGLVSHWTSDATLINPAGRVARGTAELERLFTEEHAGAMGTTEKLASLSAHFLTADLAWVDVDLTVDGARGPDGKPLPQFKFHLAGLVKKVDARWLWYEGRPYAFVK